MANVSIPVDPSLVRNVAISSAVSPSTLNFTSKAFYRPFSLLRDDYSTLLDDKFTSDSGFYRDASFPGSHSIAGGVMTLTGVEYQIHRTKFEAPFITIIADVKSMSGDGTNDVIAVGLATATATNQCYVYWNRNTGNVLIETSVSGSITTLATISASLTAPFQLAFTLNENEVSVWSCSTNDDKFILHGTASVLAKFDMRDPAVFTTFFPAVLGVSSSSNIKLSRLRAGYFGTVGFQNPNLVRWIDGTPYIRNGEVYLVATNAGVSSKSGTECTRATYAAVYALNLKTLRLRQTAHLFVSRSSKVLSDLGGSICFDPATGLFTWINNTWGDYTSGNTVVMNYYTTAANILSGVHVLTGGTAVGITTSKSCWEGDWFRYNGTYYVAYAETTVAAEGGGWTFYPCIASGASLDTLSTIVKRTALTQYEGEKVQKIGGTPYVLAGSSLDMKVLNLSDLSTNATLTADAVVTSGGYPSHPCVIPYNDAGDLAQWLLVGFDGKKFANAAGTDINLTWGNVQIQRSSVTQTGYEFPSRNPPYGG